MNIRYFLYLTTVLIIFVSATCIFNEISWTSKESSNDAARETIGIPSIIVGNLSPAARNPGLELLCTGLYDTPGGYCNYFTNGVPHIEFLKNGNFTVSD